MQRCDKFNSLIVQIKKLKSSHTHTHTPILFNHEKEGNSTICKKKKKNSSLDNLIVLPCKTINSRARIRTRIRARIRTQVS